MSSSMKERGQAFENRFFHDEDLRFRARARCNRLTGIWAAGKLGLSGEKAEDYAEKIVINGLGGPDGREIMRQIMDDFNVAGISVSEKELEERMAFFLREAMDQIRRD